MARFVVIPTDGPKETVVADRMYIDHGVLVFERDKKDGYRTHVLSRFFAAHAWLEAREWRGSDG